MMTNDTKHVQRFSQVWASRRGPMENLIAGAFDRPISLLEIGTACGVGSSQIWLANVPDGSIVTLIDAWKPYASEGDLDDHPDYRMMDLLTADSFLSTYVAIRRFETEYEKRAVDVRMIRADSAGFLSLFAPESFDFIYIDGDHKYDKIKADIVNAKRLVKSDFGIICGDDLEYMPTPDRIEVARNFKARDFLRAPHWFHPGVLLAVAEEFETVGMLNGFWWAVRRNGIFTEAWPGRS